MSASIVVRDIRLPSISGDLYTIGMDGYIRVWDQDIINDLQPPGEDVKMVQFEPNGELFVGKGAIGEVERVFMSNRGIGVSRDEEADFFTCTAGCTERRMGGQTDKTYRSRRAASP